LKYESIYKKNDIREVYKQVLSGKVGRFPPFTWLPKKGGYENIRNVIRYLILERLKWDRDKCIKNYDSNFIEKYKLKGAIGKLYESSAYRALVDAIPEWKIKAWELSHVPSNFWTKETLGEAIRWLVEEKFGLSPDNPKEVLKNITYKTLIENGISGPSRFNINNIADCLSVAYPEQVWKNVISRKEIYAYQRQNYNIFLHFLNYLEGKKEPFPSYIWKGEKAKEAFKTCIRHLILVKLEYTREEYLEKMNTEFLKPYGLYGGLCEFFRGSAYYMTEDFFPEWEIKPWELKAVPINYWKKGRNVIKAFKWLIEKNGWSKEEAERYLSREIAIQFGLKTAFEKIDDKERIIELIYEEEEKSC
jgi:hypothetical protein